MSDPLRSVFDGLGRRQFITGIAAAGAATWVAGPSAVRAAASSSASSSMHRFRDFTAIAPTADDSIHVPDGYESEVLIAWGDEFGEGLVFGYNADFTAYFPRSGIDGMLWVNHEYVIPYFTSDWRASQDPSWDPRNNVDHAGLEAHEKQQVGGSLVHVRRQHGRRRSWEVVKGSRLNRRFTAVGPEIPYDGPVAGSGLVPGAVLGTLANCSGGVTPWGTILTAEENYQSYGLKRLMPFNLGWSNNGDPNYYVGEAVGAAPLNAFGEPAVEVPNYGYVCEIDPFTGAAVKHTALGRLHHENVAIRIARDGRVVAYTGDDAPLADGMFFKFVSKRKFHKRMRRSETMSLLSEGQLYVARFLPSADFIDGFGTGEWLPVEMSPQGCAFTTAWVRSTYVPSRASLAELQVPRAEDCEILPNDPRTVLIALTTAAGEPNVERPTSPYGVVRALREDHESPDSLTFVWNNFITGGPTAGLAAPDNMAFTSDREVWLATDVSASTLNVPGRGHVWHGNNAIFMVPLRGPNTGVAFRFANAPVAAEFTGPTFVDADTLFLSVQHPGESTPIDAPIDVAAYTSYWPNGNKTTGEGVAAKPKPAVVTIRKR